MEPVIGRPAPSGGSGRKVIRTIAADQIHPVIRIAHRQCGPLNIPERIIFDHELVLILKGRGDYFGEAAATPFAPGTLLFIRPFVPHAFTSCGHLGEHLAVHFDFTRDPLPGGNDPQRRRSYGVQFADNLSLPAVRQCGTGDPVAEAFADMVRARERADVKSSLVEIGCLMRMLGTLLALPHSVAVGSSRDTVRVRRALDYLHACLAEPFDQEQLAGIAGLSRGHITRLFRDQTGYTPSVYLRRARVARARQLLADVNLSIKQIARQCGFADAYHFSRVFREIDGLSPSLFREAALAGKTT